MRQYLEVKEAHPEGIVFFRMGDFYEMFFEDAVLAAQLLDLTLTSRDKGRDDAIPMAGVPHHAARGYVARLTELGHKVVLVEQVEDPKLAKGLVKREVVRIITPGVVLDEEVLDPKSARYLAAVATSAGGDGKRRADGYGLAYLDVSTGEFRATEIDSLDGLVAELGRIGAREVLATAEDLSERGRLAPLRRRHRAAVYTPCAALSASEVEQVLGALVPSSTSAAVRAAAGVLAYARATQPGGVVPVRELCLYRPGDAVVLDEAAVANLELTETLIGARRDGSLLAAIDRTRTAPGGRLLRRWLLYPLAEVAPIRRRQDAVEFFFERATLREEVREALRGVADLERLAGRFSLGVGTPRDLGRLRDSLERLPALVQRIEADASVGAALAGMPPALRFSAELCAALAALAGELRAALVDDPPPSAREGGVIRTGYCPLLDERRELARGGKGAVLAIEARERERTGIPSLRIRYNRVFGYYIEVTRAHLSRVPVDYVRKQTIATAERYVTLELAELEGKILLAEEELLAREQELFTTLSALVAARVADILAAGERVAQLDCCAGLAEVAAEHRYVRPMVDESQAIEIRDGRHPVVERAVGEGAYVPNDCELDTERRQLLLITGPNMAGKSTYMRQVAHIVLLAQMGSFVPAQAARVGLVDRIFTRVGAADNLARGESTFMVEMRESAAILRGASRSSLVVLDEIGRGTSTYDGLSIAWAVAEHLHDAIGARTLFATHYHELCALAERLPRVHNASVAVGEHRGEIVFLHRLMEGGADKSYGIEVARLAGLPPPVLARARAMLAELEGRRLTPEGQLDLFLPGSAAVGAPAVDAGLIEIAKRLQELDLDRTTPLEALHELAALRCLAGSIRT
jgi:DNA mismatch repair protein MutS